jgi:hypothetical protein
MAVLQKTLFKKNNSWVEFGPKALACQALL